MYMIFLSFLGLCVTLGVFYLASVFGLVLVRASLSKENLQSDFGGLCLSYLHAYNLMVKTVKVKFFFDYFTAFTIISRVQM